VRVLDAHQAFDDERYSGVRRGIAQKLVLVAQALEHRALVMANGENSLAPAAAARTAHDLLVGEQAD